MDGTDIGEVVFARDRIQDILAEKMGKQPEAAKHLYEAQNALDAILRRHSEEAEAYYEHLRTEAA